MTESTPRRRAISTHDRPDARLNHTSLIVPLPPTAVYLSRLRTYARLPPITATTSTINQTGAPPLLLGSSAEGDQANGVL